MSSNPGDERDKDPATVVASPSFDELLALRSGPAAPPVAKPGPSWTDDIAYAQTAIGASYDEQMHALGLEVPASEPPPPERSGALPVYAPPPPPPGPPPAAPPPPAERPPAAAPPPPAGALAQPPLAKTIALDLSQNPLWPPQLDPGAQPPPSAPFAPAPPAPATPAPYTPAPVTPYPGVYAPAPAPPAWSAAAPVRTAAPASSPSRLVLFVAAFAVVFLVGGVCFGGAAAYLLMGR